MLEKLVEKEMSPAHIFNIGQAIGHVAEVHPTFNVPSLHNLWLSI